MLAEEGVLVGVSNIELVEEEEEEVTGFDLRLEDKASVSELSSGDAGCEELRRGCRHVDIFSSGCARTAGLSSGVGHWFKVVPQAAFIRSVGRRA